MTLLLDDFFLPEIQRSRKIQINTHSQIDIQIDNRCQMIDLIDDRYEFIKYVKGKQKLYEKDKR